MLFRLKLDDGTLLLCRPHFAALVSDGVLSMGEGEPLALADVSDVRIYPTDPGAMCFECSAGREPPV